MLIEIRIFSSQYTVRFDHSEAFRMCGEETRSHRETRAVLVKLPPETNEEKYAAEAVAEIEAQFAANEFIFVRWTRERTKDDDRLRGQTRGASPGRIAPNRCNPTFGGAQIRARFELSESHYEVHYRKNQNVNIPHIKLRSFHHQYPHLSI